MKAVILALLCSLIAPKNQQGETLDEARARYETIAEAITWASDDSRTVALYLVTIARYESAFWRNVHEGSLGGDCDHDEEGKPIMATCKSWCAVQINFDKRKHAPLTGYTREQLVGLDAASTRRCFETGAAFVRYALKRCGDRPACVFATYGGVSSTDPRLASRVKTYRRLSRK